MRVFRSDRYELEGKEVPMTDPIDLFDREWHRIVAEKDRAGLERVLAEDVTVGVPPYWQKLHGRAIAVHLLNLIIHTIEEFTYHREWHNGRELALEFTGNVGDVQLQGIDLITLDEQGIITNLDVLMRPVNAIIELRGVIAPQMAAFLQERAAQRESSG
jgi:hypothetical protein